MAGRATNQALLVLVVGAVASGLTMFALGTGWNRWATIAHGAAGVAVVALTPWKAGIASRGTRRRGLRRALPSFALVATVVTVLVTGFAHRGGARPVGPVDVLQIHVAAAAVSSVLLVAHARSRPFPRFTRTVDLDRRRVLRAGLLGGGAVVATAAAPHASDRFTRSVERGSGDPSAMPVTQWFLDEVPRLHPESWRLLVAGRYWTLAELTAIPAVELDATLDCTGGWYARQRWTGLPVALLLADSGAGPGRSIVVRSATGYSRRFPRRDAPHLLLATGVGDEALSPGHGFPARLVAPGRRGFWWVKWVTEVEVDDRPWWWQLPFPPR